MPRMRTRSCRKRSSKSLSCLCTPASLFRRRKEKLLKYTVTIPSQISSAEILRGIFFSFRATQTSITMKKKILSTKDIIVISAGILGLLLCAIILSKQQTHILFEALAIPFGTYFIWYGLTKANGVHKWIFVIFGSGNIIVDGYLLFLNCVNM